MQLHFEVAHCEVSSDLLTKGSAEYQRANSLDYTAADSELLEPVKQILATPADDGGLGRDPAPYLRRFDTAMHSQLHLLYWKTTLYEEPTDPVDQVMLVLDQVSKVTGAKNEHGEVMPLSEEKKKLNHSLLVQAFAKLETCLEDLISPERMEQLSDSFEPPPRHILDENPSATFAPPGTCNRPVACWQGRDGGEANPGQTAPERAREGDSEGQGDSDADVPLQLRSPARRGGRLCCEGFYESHLHSRHHHLRTCTD